MFFVLHANVCGTSLPHHGHSHAGSHGHSHGSGHAHEHVNVNVDPLAVDMVHGDEHEQLPPVKRAETNLNVRAAIIHVIGDFVQSVGVLCAAILIKFKVGRIRNGAYFFNDRSSSRNTNWPIRYAHSPSPFSC